MTRELYSSGLMQVKAYRILQNAVAEVVREHGLGSVSEWFVLSHVAGTDQVIAKDLAALLEVEASLITRLLGNLEQKGLVQISPHATDGRIKYIQATADARALVAKVNAAMDTTLAGLLSGVSPEELASYDKVLETISRNGAKV